MLKSKSKSENLMNLVMQLRKVCNHPELFERKQCKSPVIFRKAHYFRANAYVKDGTGSNIRLVVSDDSPIEVIIPKLFPDSL